MSVSHSSVHPPISDPGTLLSNLPAIFGFYPADSIVFVCLLKAGPGRFSLGPVVRMDASDPAALDVLDRTDSPLLDADYVLGFLIGHAADTDTVAEIPAFAAELESRLIGVWGCTEISTGASYHLIYGDAARFAAEWVAGAIGTIIESAAMQPWISAGQLPELSRRDLHDQFDRNNPYLDPADAECIQNFGEDTAIGLLDSVAEPEAGAIGAQEVIENFTDYLQHIASRNVSVTMLQDNELFLETAAVICGHVRLRDSVVSAIVESPECGARASLAAASTFSETPRAHALALYALARIAAGLPMLATPALEAALSADPGHNLSRLILRFLETGQHGRLLEAVEEGSRQAQAYFFRCAE